LIYSSGSCHSELQLWKRDNQRQHEEIHGRSGDSLLQVANEQVKHLEIFGWQIMNQIVDHVHTLIFVLLFCNQMA
jgi:hypothetical protein